STCRFRRTRRLARRPELCRTSRRRPRARAAIRTEARDLDRGAGDGEADLLGARGDRGADAGIVELGRRLAAGADQELPDMALVGIGAADIGVERFDAVDEAVLDQELERAIDGGRLRAHTLLAEAIEQRVGTDRRVALPDQLEHAPALIGEPRAARQALALGRGQRVVDAERMIVAGRRKSTALLLSA